MTCKDCIHYFACPRIINNMGVSYNQYLSKIDVLQIIDKYRQNGAKMEGGEK